MDLELFVFWGGLVSLLIVAALLADLDLNRMRARTPSCRGSAEKDSSASAPSGWKLLHTVRRGRETARVWSIEGRAKGDVGHALTVERKDSQCRDCMSCVNEALEWLQQQERLESA
jgi:hypothetical protein